MQYLEKIGKKAKRAFEDLKSIDQKRVKKVLDNYNTNLFNFTPFHSILISYYFFYHF